MKPSLTVAQQVELLAERGLVIEDRDDCARFFRSTNYYRFSGYTRYLQRAPHLGDNTFEPSTSFEAIRAIYDADEELRAALTRPLAHAELLLRTHTDRSCPIWLTSTDNTNSSGRASSGRSLPATTESDTALPWHDACF